MTGRAMTPVNARQSPSMDQSTQSDHSQKAVGAIGSRGAYRQHGDNQQQQRGRGGSVFNNRGGWNNYRDNRDE